MRQVNIVLSPFCGFILLFGSLAVTADTPEIDCSVEPYNGELFSSLYQATQRTALSFCQSLMQTRIKKNAIDTQDINAQARQLLTDFAAEARKAVDEKSLSGAANYQDQFGQLDKTFERFNFSDPKLPELNVRKSLGSKVEGFFVPLLEEEDRFSISEVDQCASISAGMSCRNVFEDFAGAFNPYRSAYNRVYDNTAALDELGNEWDRFLGFSKSQTTLEVFLTTRIQRSHFKKNHLVGPPDYQVIALHPHLIYSHMEDAPDGSNQEIGLALEWFGINFWDWKVPLGISFATTHVDRAGFNDTGKGIMFHIDNHYAIGWAEHGDEDSVYVTLDLLKLFEDKKQQYQAYLDQYFD